MHMFWSHAASSSEATGSESHGFLSDRDNKLILVKDFNAAFTPKALKIFTGVYMLGYLWLFASLASFVP